MSDTSKIHFVSYKPLDSIDPQRIVVLFVFVALKTNAPLLSKNAFASIHLQSFMPLSHLGALVFVLTLLNHFVGSKFDPENSSLKSNTQFPGTVPVGCTLFGVLTSTKVGGV